MRPQQDKYAWTGDELVMTSSRLGVGESSSSSSSNATTMRATTTTTTTTSTTTNLQNNNNNNRHLIARVVVISENFFGLRLTAENCLTAAASNSSDRSLVTSKLYNSRTSARHEVFKIHLYNSNNTGNLI